MITSSVAPVQGARELSRRSSMAQWINMLGTVAIDMRRFLPLPVMMAALLLGLMLWKGIEAGREIVISFHGMCGVLSLMLGLAISSDDKERGTLWTLRALPASPAKLFMQKLIAALILIVLFLLLAELSQFLAVINNYQPGFLLIPTLSGVMDPTMWNFGVWWPISLAQFICMVSVGLACGVIFRNLFSAAILAFVIYTAWYVAWAYGFRWLESTNRQRIFHVVMVVQLSLLTVGATWGFLRGVRWQSGIAFLDWKPGAISTESTRGILDRWFPSSPYLDRVIRGGIVCLTLTLVAQISYFWWLDDHRQTGDAEVVLYSLTLLVSAGIFGSLLFSAKEMVSPESILYWQPVRRYNLLWQRARWIIPYAIASVLLFAVIWWNRLQKEPVNPEDFLVVFTFTVLACLNALLFRLFLRNAMFSFVLATLSSSVSGGLMLILTKITDRLDSLSNSLWISAIVMAVPAIAVCVAFCRTHLMHQAFGRRSALAISVFVTLLAATLLLATTDPGELLIIVNHKLQVMLEGGK